ncbi:protein phosphatase 2C domain-containing protein [Catenulispora sp. NF23]|uniref:Protein phosphatase 2C domain-containing protein n=1 Tax=Catenulispora pinistramenti TaxID=2705254 RepID=A0ABS5KPC1_9ACTN|nr:protein phosphatase 2C domain-containing protein [Catenulispora pinistramenti]MBS2532706.1 protein phosphatase 2C domain-containing protein [Catenulispora pinistramenti]MBS2547877.1 protein phosphatase 2C domain-containing protein [Catenulispora pinistramenti]
MTPQTTFATSAGADVNEDTVTAGADFALVLDGATAEPDTDSGCRHGVRWFATQLAGRLAARLAVDACAAHPLTDVLHDAIDAVGRSHSDSCDLRNLCSPSSTVVLVRHRQDHTDCLVLGDSPLVIARRDGAVFPLMDDRLSRFSGPWSQLRYTRNAPGGFWIAGNNPEAARHALVATVPTADLAALALLTDGATRLVERYGWSWRDLMTLLRRDGPAELINQTRAAERQTPAGRFVGKRHDDATAVLCHFGDAPSPRAV